MVADKRPIIFVYNTTEKRYEDKISGCQFLQDTRKEFKDIWNIPPYNLERCRNILLGGYFEFKDKIYSLFESVIENRLKENG